MQYVRYADDFSIYLKQKSKAKEVGNKIYLFLKNKLKLSINREKSGIRTPSEFKILGYEFTTNLGKGKKGYLPIPSTESWDKLKRSLKQITKKTIPYSFDTRYSNLKEVYRGWLNYFRLHKYERKTQAPRQLAEKPDKILTLA